MCTSVIITFGVSAIEGLAGGVLQNYRLNDLQVPPRKNHHHGGDGDDNESRLTPLLTTAMSEIRRRALEDFNDTDQMYEEFHPPPDGLSRDENENSFEVDFNWKMHRKPKAWRWLLRCYLYSFFMVVVCSFLIAVVSVTIMYIDINTSDVCFHTKWYEIPIKIRHVRVTVQVLQGWILQFFHIGIMIFVFGFKLVDQLHLLHLNVVAAFLDSVYRLFLQVYDQYDWTQKMYPLNVIFIGVMIANSYTLAAHFSAQRRRKLILTFQLGSQFLLGSTTLFLTVYLLIPWFIRLSPIQQAFVAALSPIFGAICKAVSRISIQNVSHINHPGTSYMLVIGLYAGSALVYRTLQAEIESMVLFFVLCIAHALIGLLERLSVVLRDHFYMWFYKKVLRSERDYNSFIGSFRTPRTQRLVADLTICNIIHETNALIYTNAFVQLYALQVGVKNASDVVGQFFFRTVLAILIEYVSTGLGVFILTWYLNIPVIRVWRKKWKSILAVNLFACSSLVIYSTHYLIDVVAGQYYHQQQPILGVTSPMNNTSGTNGTAFPCMVSRLPFFN